MTQNIPEQGVLTRVAQATGLTEAEVSAWLNKDDTYDLASLEDQLYAALGETDDPVGTLVERGVITPAERDELTA